MATGYYLLDNKNPYGPHYYTKRNSPLLHIVLHITAGLEDLDGVSDQSAEKTARYAATTDRPVSWHAAADSDSCFYLLPDTYTAFHAQGFNASGYGLEISKTNTRWSGVPDAWTEATLRQTARILAPVVRKYSIPLQRLTRAQAQAGQKGFLYHSDADPTRRTDPGADFPLSRLFALIEAELNPTTAIPLEDEVFRLIETADTKRRYVVSGNRLIHLAPGEEESFAALGALTNPGKPDDALQVQVDRVAAAMRRSVV